MDENLSEIETFDHLVSNIFLPLRLPQAELDEDSSRRVDLLIARSVIRSIHQYKANDPINQTQWNRIIRMVESLASYLHSPLDKAKVARDMTRMTINGKDVLALHIRAQNAAVIIRKGLASTTFEIFEAQAPSGDIMANPGKLLLRYPGPAVEISRSIANDVDFIREIANFLAQSDTKSFEEAVPTTNKGGSTVRETREATDSTYFTQLFLGIVGGMGTVFSPPGVFKRIADEVSWKDARNPWRRSPLWLIIRVALQTSLDSKLLYKSFMAYHHAYLISHCLEEFSDNFSGEVLYMMRAKLARRLFKLRDSAPTFVVEFAKAVAEGTQNILQGRWTALQEDQMRLPRWDSTINDFQTATNITLPNSRAYLEQLFRGRKDSAQLSSFTPNDTPRLNAARDLGDFADGALQHAFSAHNGVALFDFESYIDQHLPAWVDLHLADAESGCLIVYSCFQQYLSVARSHYITDVVDQSIMVLTLMTLWFAIDRLATSACVLLLQFPPEIPADILDTLLLHSSNHLEQARAIQRYILHRKSHANTKNSSIFADKIGSNCFAVQYFRQSSALQELKASIEISAQEARDSKVMELEEKNQESTRLSQEAEQMEHQYVPSGRLHTEHTQGDFQPMEHAQSCMRCSLERRSRSMYIKPHEWPLPTNQLQAEAIVFELQRPDCFTIWRDTTYQILRDLATKSSNENVLAIRGTLEEYKSLQLWHDTSKITPARIILASCTKSFGRSHYSKIGIPASQGSVCVNNGLNFKIYDRSRGISAAGPFKGLSFAQYATFKLPNPSLYQHLSYAVANTTHTSNQVLSGQHDCPKDLSLHEHIAFGTLRSGPQIQWLNILRGLEENILTFNRTEVSLLHTQAAWQIGPLSDDLVLRKWHADLEEPCYRTVLVAQCHRFLERVKENWLEANSVYIIVVLVTRLLAASDSTSNDSAYNLLREIRKLTSKWLFEIQEKMHEAGTKSSITDYQCLICEIAMICRSTFDVGPVHLPRILRTSEALTPLITSAIILHDNQPSDINATQDHFKVLLCRESRLAHQVAPYIRQLLSQDKHMLSASLSHVWPGYDPSAQGWSMFTGPNESWVCTTTMANKGAGSQIVHFNLLNGRLLIDGIPLGRLPRQYYEDSVYVQLFGERVLHVVPSSCEGMEFATRDQIHGYQVLFALGKCDRQLIIQARRGNQTFQLVPPSELSADLPEFFSTDYHHWADVKAKTIELRPLSHPWSQDHCQWIISFNQRGGAAMKNLDNGFSLVDIHSQLFRSISAQLAPLESARYLHISQSSNLQTHVALPRMKLQFFINDNMEIESHNFRGQVIDTNQSTGTLFGLQNQLVLCAKQAVEQPASQSRSVLIPHGDVSVTIHRHHVLVNIQPGSNRSIAFHRYQVNTDLGCLASDSGLTSRLYKIYLHALSSHCLPDVLTGRTGTEEALHELTEPATSSFDQIDDEQAHLLGLIGSLTPKREYYPEHLRRMQTTWWQDIPVLSQHHGFRTASADILGRADTMRLFFPLDFTPTDLSTSVNETLVKRAIRRAVPFYPPDIAQSRHLTGDSFSHTSCHTSIIEERLSLNWGPDSQSAAWAYRLLRLCKIQAIREPLDLVGRAETWGLLSGPREDLSLTYSPQWLSLDLGETWISMYNLLRDASISVDFYGLCICLATVIFSQKLPLQELPMLVSFVVHPTFSQLDLPHASSFKLQEDGYAPLRLRIESIVASKVRHISKTPVAQLRKQVGEAKRVFKLRKQEEYDEHILIHQPAIVDFYLDQWPSTQLVDPPSSNPCSLWFDVESCTSEVEDYFLSCTRNVDLRNRLRQIEQALSSGSVGEQPRITNSLVLRRIEKQELEFYSSRISHCMPSLGYLMNSRPDPECERFAVLSRIALLGRTGVPVETARISSLFNEFQTSERHFDRHYGHNLDESRKELDFKRKRSVPKRPPPRQCFVQNYQLCRSHTDSSFQMLEHALGPVTQIEHILSASGIWPRLTPRTILACLSLCARTHHNLSLAWYNMFIGYAQAFVEYQHAQRLLELSEAGNTEELLQELDPGNSTESDTDMCDPDWLLVQISGNFRARSMQLRVAREMISPSSAKSTVLQLNMGEGKSSVIVPMIAATLANSQKLVRVIVLKPLWRQMFHLLVNRLAGLVHRRIYYLPFARNVQLDSSQADKLQELYEECMREGGILLAQPEHILSFKLMGIDHLVSSSQTRQATSSQLRRIQQWLTANTRDILDESDEILNVRYQLVYTVGTQRPPENHPDRWTITQQLLHIAANHILRLKASATDALIHETAGRGRYPTIRILPDCDQSTEHQLVTSIADEIMDGRILSLNFSRFPVPTRQLIYRFLTEKDISYTDSHILFRVCDEVTQKGLLLLRGLLALGILIFALKNKRYRVDYGLDLSRSLLAVPFRAKDVPSLRSEFGHPDVAILLTCLSYYYKGLKSDQLRTCFDILYALDNPPLEYEQWLRGSEIVPSDLIQLNGINMKDHEQFNSKIVPMFSHNPAVINFFLSSAVFPKAAKEFPYKLASSGWDLAETKPHITTGFSGTNDNRYVLPTSITQSDPIQQLSTNALVLTYLLQSENNHYLCMRDESGTSLTTVRFLELLVDQQPEIRVLLDVGAQMLELQNEDLVRCWLGLRPDIEAAVCFNHKDELIVVTQNGSHSPFYSSPFSQQLDKCIVYLDDAHTRGTDLKLPLCTRALVTLGPKVTKDRLLQGCMRMRKLGHGQSVIFAAPPEIDRQIRKSAPQPLGLEENVDVLDILRWTMLETCKDLQHQVSNWVQQGLEHDRRVRAEDQYSTSGNVAALKAGWMTPETRSLEEMYGVKDSAGLPQHTLSSQVRSIPAFRERLEVFGKITLNDSRVDEEQEREVSHEVERQHQIEYPSKEQPALHQLHQDVLHFVRTGKIPPRASGIGTLFSPLHSSNPRMTISWSNYLVASVDFLLTTKNIPPVELSDYMRPVNWILRGTGGVQLILSPFEVNELLPRIRQSKVVQLHVYAPRTTHAMKSFSDLQFYSIPHTQPSLPRPSALSSHQLQLDLFAGQLYLASYQGYELLCAILGIYNLSQSQNNALDVQTNGDGFLAPEHRQRVAEFYPQYALCTFASSPIPILRELIGRRRKGMEYIRTHLGQVLYSRSLTPNDF